jgi:hypothetical protein
MNATSQTTFAVGQHIRMTYANGVYTDGVIAEVKSDRVRAIPFNQKDDGIGFGFAVRAIGKVISVQVI